ncbi:enoyl-CoA hydratase [Thalassorhabdomicrobium marinisediminis]|uniref:Enoyl-CoA hydratase n=2 Tax=Thalassorhabdomicrobium marinisediminis TaxID=2170577 RepID=A0A2T7FTL7_9RHOB|nr:enoyl-CoA hydratase [Thalassorhabdomicrobium marinisediminis]
MLQRGLTGAALVALAACYVPADPEGTTEDVTGSTLRVGLLTPELDPLEDEVVARLAGALQAEVEVVTGDPHQLFDQLTHGALHILAGQIPSDTPFADHAALSDPLGVVMTYDGEADWVLLLRRGENRFLVTANRAIKGAGR